MATQRKQLTDDLLSCFTIFLDLEQTAKLVRCSESKIELMIGKPGKYSDASFPKPVTVKGEAVTPGRKRLWIIDEVIQWIFDNIKKERGTVPHLLVKRLKELGFLQGHISDE